MHIGGGAPPLLGTKRGSIKVLCTHYFDPHGVYCEMSRGDLTYYFLCGGDQVISILIMMMMMMFQVL